MGKNKCSQHLSLSTDGLQLEGISVSFLCSLGYKNIPCAIAFFKGQLLFLLSLTVHKHNKHRVTSPNQLSDLINRHQKSLTAFPLSPNCIPTFTRAPAELRLDGLNTRFTKGGSSFSENSICSRELNEKERKIIKPRSCWHLNDSI